MSRAVWLLGAAAILPIAAIAAAETPQAVGAFTPPPTPHILIRTLRHMLHDGKAVVTRRSYRVQFVPEGNGFRVDGALIGVEVEALPGLEALAELERNRSDAGMFPMLLDRSGMIVPTGDPAPTTQQRQAIGTASTEIARLNLAAVETSQAQGFVSQFQARPYRTYWPIDLFHPAPGPRRDQRTVPLAGGLSGKVTTDIVTSTHSATGLLAGFERKVTTDIEGNTRVIVEQWSLTPAP